jgi:integrase
LSIWLFNSPLLLQSKLTAMSNLCRDFSINFYIRRNGSIKRDYSIYCCIKTSCSSPKELCLVNSIKREEWDLRKGRPKHNNDKLIKLSLYLDTIKAKLFEIYFDLKLNKSELSAEIIKSIYLGKGTNDYTILQLIDEAIKKYQKELAKGSLKNYAATRAYVTGICKQKYKSGDIRLKFLTYSFIDELKTYILSNSLKPNDPCTNNGCMKHLERIKKMITWAYEMRFIERNVFASFKIKKHPYESQKLHWEQLKTLESKTFQRPLLNLVRDLFVFCCYTGMAPIDVQHLQPHQIYKGTDDLMWLTYYRTKSKIPAHVPLLTLALALIKKYECKKNDLPRDTVFPFVTNQYLNDSLKVISELCEFGILLNFYVSRHTFATIVTLFQGVPITSIKEMMGHRKIESTIHYARADKSAIAKDMKLLEEKMYP